jgi:WD40 repeat protein
VLLWDADKGELLRELGPFPAADPNSRMMWSPDGRFLAFPASPLKELGWHVWDVEQNKLVNNPKEWKDTWLVFSPDRRSVLVGTYGDVYRLRDLTSGKEVRSLPVGVLPWGIPPVWSPDGRLLAVPLSWGVELWRGDLSRRVRTLHVAYEGVHQVSFSADGKLTIGQAGERLHVWETDTGRLRGIMLLGEKNNDLTLTADGHYTGNDQVERGIVMVVQKDDGTQELLEPADFEQNYGWKNEPDKVHLLQPLPPPLYPLPGMPMGPNTLVREPTELPDANSWTIESVNARGLVNAVASRPDGKLLATGGDDGTIRLWDPADGRLVRMLVGDRVLWLEWSKDGKVLNAGGPGDREGREWDAATGRLLRRVSGAARPAAKTARSPDGKQTATADEHGVRLLDTATGKQTLALEEGIGDQQVLSLAWSPDSRRVAVGCPYGKAPLRIVEAGTGQRRPGPQDAFTLAAWSPDGRTLAAKGPENSLQLWDAFTLRPLRTMDLAGHTSSLGLGAMEWSPDGKMLAAGGEGHFFVWSADTGKVFYYEHRDNFGAPLAWSPDGGRLAVGQVEGDAVHPRGAVYTWQCDNGKLMQVAPLPPGRLGWSPDGRKLALANAWATDVALIDSGSGKVLSKGPEGIVDTAAFHWSPDGNTFAAFHRRFGTEGASLCVWDGERCTLLRTTRLQGMPEVQCAAWSPDGRVLACARNSQVHLHDAAGQPLGVLLPFDTFGQLAITADGHYRGNARVEREIRMVVQKRDGTSETLTPGEFEQKYGFKNEPDKVQLGE